MHLLTRAIFGFMLATIWDSYFGVIRGYLFLLKVQMMDTLIISSASVTGMYRDRSALKLDKRCCSSFFKTANISVSLRKHTLVSSESSILARGYVSFFFFPYQWSPHSVLQALRFSLAQFCCLCEWLVKHCKRALLCAYCFQLLFYLLYFLLSFMKTEILTPPTNAH